jgi:hypothetical protein
MINRIICFFLGHLEEEFDKKTIYMNSGGWHVIVYSWRCLRCERIREYER